MRVILRYFDLNRAAGQARLGAAEAVLGVLDQFAMYVGAFLGVVLSTPLLQYVAGEVVAIDVTGPVLLLSAAAALLILPLAAQAVNPAARPFIRFALFFQHGVFWRVLIGAIGKGFGVTDGG